MGSRISPMMASAMGRISAGSQGATVGSQSRRSSRVNAVTWARFSPSILLLRAFSDYRMLIYSVVLIIVMIFKPSGLLGRYEFSLTGIIERFTGRGSKVKKTEEGGAGK